MLCSSYSYSDETIFESSPNAAASGLNWVMANVLPQYTGLTVNSVIYQYSTVKETEDDMTVAVQNENAQGPGYIFREVDDWSGQPSNTIYRVVPVGQVPLELWGDGSIEVEGDGVVEDARVVYNYQYVPKDEPTEIPDLPDPPKIEDSEDYIQSEIDRKANQRAQREEEERREREAMEEAEEEKKSSMQALEALLGTLILNDLQGSSEALHSQLTSLNYLTPAYEAELIDPGYEDAVVLSDAELPDNASARRVNLAQDRLHQQMVNSQYEEK